MKPQHFIASAAKWPAPSSHRIASLDADSRQNFRAKALCDPAAWIGRNVSPHMFDRHVTSGERRLMLNETQHSGSQTTRKNTERLIMMTRNRLRDLKLGNRKLCVALRGGVKFDG